MAHDGNDLQTASRRVVIVGPDAWSMIRLRGSLIRSLSARRHRVLCIVPAPTASDVEEMGKLGAECLGWAPKSAVIDVLSHRRSIDELTRLLAEQRAYTVMGYGLMPMLIASIAGKRAGAARVVPLVSSLAGLPQQGAALGWSLKRLAKSAFRAADGVICHNDDDRRRLVELGLLPARIPVQVVPGGGVDLNRFETAPLQPLDRGLVFATVARLDRSKGLLELAEAARRIRERSDRARFVLVGPDGTGPGKLTAAEVSAASAGAVEVSGEVADVRPVIAGCHVYLLPSHLEGMPRTVLEALAMGRPVLTTDIPGAREAVDERVNGVLVEPGNVDQLVAAIESYLKRPDLIASMARASRLKAERRFSADAVNATIERMLLATVPEGHVA